MAALPNWKQGARRPSMIITFLREDSAVPEPLTGATMTGFIGPESGVGTVAAITGTLSVTNGAAGIFTWDLSAADVQMPGRLVVDFVASFGSSPTPAKTFSASWSIERALAVT